MVYQIPTANTSYLHEGSYAIEQQLVAQEGTRPTAASKAASSEHTSSPGSHHDFENPGKLTTCQNGKPSRYFT